MVVAAVGASNFAKPNLYLINSNRNLYYVRIVRVGFKDVCNIFRVYLVTIGKKSVYSALLFILNLIRP